MSAPLPSAYASGDGLTASAPEPGRRAGEEEDEGALRSSSVPSSDLLFTVPVLMREARKERSLDRTSFVALRVRVEE